ncbi:hypothetical protein M501DRAFT_998665 [Patellaria atrata CBS 101060]|uniref:Uncharacterized protein n=1 Tax=Patellaria atrata CBS 101060 TaxID=1346257 RepID=A0A9P4SH31_9PEZI|nr:hypothetical protein M501DRAFT_998665 [Patellaria atrata CBS 101060]
MFFLPQQSTWGLVRPLKPGWTWCLLVGYWGPEVGGVGDWGVCTRLSSLHQVALGTLPVCWGAVRDDGLLAELGVNREFINFRMSKLKVSNDN